MVRGASGNQLNRKDLVDILTHIHIGAQVLLYWARSEGKHTSSMQFLDEICQPYPPNFIMGFEMLPTHYMKHADISIAHLTGIKKNHRPNRLLLKCFLLRSLTVRVHPFERSARKTKNTLNSHCYCYA